MSQGDRPGAGALPPRRQTVLLVEGSPVLRERLARLLADLPGVAVAEAASAAEAMTHLARHGADAVVVDVDQSAWRDPGVLGLIRRAAPSATLIAIGADDSRELVEFCRALGADHFLRIHTGFARIGEMLRSRPES